jgi:hypothetical protein
LGIKLHNIRHRIEKIPSYTENDIAVDQIVIE